MITTTSRRRGGAHPNLDKLCEFVEALEDLDDTEREAFIVYSDNESSKATPDSFRDAYAGQHDSWADFAESYIDEAGMLEGSPTRWSASSTTRATAATCGSAATLVK